MAHLTRGALAPLPLLTLLPAAAEAQPISDDSPTVVI